MTAVPYESDLTVRPQLVGWCAECQSVDDPWVAGHRCSDSFDEGHWFRKRRMWKCPNCDFYFLTRAGLLEHEHEWL